MVGGGEDGLRGVLDTHCTVAPWINDDRSTLYWEQWGMCE